MFRTFFLYLRSLSGLLETVLVTGTVLRGSLSSDSHVLPLLNPCIVSDTVLGSLFNLLGLLVLVFVVKCLAVVDICSVCSLFTDTDIREGVFV